MRAKKNMLLLVKLHNRELYEYPKFREYRVGKGRNLIAVFNWLTGLDAFRYAVLFDYNTKTKERGAKVGYMDRKTGIQY